MELKLSKKNLQLHLCHSACLLKKSMNSLKILIWTTFFFCISVFTNVCTCACVFGTSPTSVLSGNVRPDKSQCPLHTLFLPILLCYRGLPKVGEEERKLPAGLVAVLTTVHCIEQCLCAVLCPQAAGSQGGERRGEQMVALLVLNQREAKYLGVSDGTGKNVLLILFFGLWTEIVSHEWISRISTTVYFEKDNFIILKLTVYSSLSI